MKKIVAFIMSMMFIFGAMTVTSNAVDGIENTNVVTCGDTDYIFESGVSADVQQRVIADICGECDEDEASTYGLMCTLFGHKLETSTTSSITHKVNASDPRCLKKTYNSSVCTRCDYTETTLIKQEYISCC